MGDFKAALQSKQRALDIRINLFGEEHQSTADCYDSLGITQHELGDFKAALQSYQRAVEIRIKLFGQEHQSTADCYYFPGITQHEPQVAQARNMSIGEHRHCCVTFKI